jgi:hypothetical protein
LLAATAQKFGIPVSALTARPVLAFAGQMESTEAKRSTRKCPRTIGGK